MPTRRTALIKVMAATAATLSADNCAAETTQQTGLGLVAYNCSLRRKWLQQQNADFDLFEPLTFLRHCQGVGAGGMQVSLGVLDTARVKSLQDFANQHKLFIDGIVSPPKDVADLGRFEAEIRTAAEVGVQAVRTVVMPGRRYEQFTSLAEFREAETTAMKMLQRAEPIVTKHRVRLAVENHKDQRIDERLALFQRLSSEYIGATIDTGNSFALLDDPYGAVEALAPFAFSVHLKDQSLQEYADGFLLGDIPLGQGGFDVKRQVATIKQVKPNIRIALELITRDALKVPCLTEGYYATLSGVSSEDLARTLRFVRQHSTAELQQVSSLPLPQQVALEDANIAASLKYASQQLSL